MDSPRTPHRLSLFASLAALLGFGSTATAPSSRIDAGLLPAGYSMPFAYAPPPEPVWRRRYSRSNRKPAGKAKNMPEGYYHQILDDTKHMTPRQRRAHAAGETVVLGRLCTNYPF